MAIFLGGETAVIKPKLDELTPRQIVEELDPQTGTIETGGPQKGQRNGGEEEKPSERKGVADRRPT